ncbi:MULTISPECIES: hypothetical protein [unclassified Exiguobacterium]|uniref:hypothetical protein n=1 Tax=unclassified Exiguobacterium TaxID=2644629 RepID=UPI00103E851E|nr:MULTISPECIES: hypothetical protein [unclassified Exiguobacterium]TCI47574.1 hypothetical protein EVJ31_00605 [Exiguobacterium sp. SH5S32]TCI54458.1 hypothetical protein EVJ25_00605 [Exiguobacterium sp. SH1S4]TCI74251.1 hypothetical protein EVJ23_00605 [Exiguobacterium sp. SH1S1]
MRFEDLFLYNGTIEVFAFNYDIGPKSLTFNLQLYDHTRKRNASFRERLEANEISPQSEVVNVKLCFEDIIYMEIIDESYADGVVMTPHDKCEGHQIVRYSRSGYLEQLQETHFQLWECIKSDVATFCHYRICGLDTVLEIITMSDPTVETAIGLNCIRRGSPTIYFGGEHYYEKS